ncbi:Putative DNA-binding protein [Alloactinosynnema sp. L-07]|uniref:helix-turn-helix domain-containing protein n=1 Tax=Alloactinosynnema sp. L-07 TaxID=1653480 RepID=UPI00065EF845|nr:helix-turn-helix transcriptional regulator [Alloactinosynnema sp. L-07]CRK60309.1 Putative DNA-binding protein [Alloactinosynnema sp. L-07]
MGLKNGAASRELGALLRKHREAAGLTLIQLGELVGRSAPSLFRLEVGERGSSTEVEVVHYLVACGAAFQDVQRLVRFSRELSDERGYWLCSHGEWMGDSLRSLVFHESSVARSLSYEPEVIPGMLQTEAYMRALLLPNVAPGADVERSVQARIERQCTLFRRNAAKFTFLVHERALRTVVNDRRTMAEQLLAMLFLADQWNIKIRIVPEGQSFGGSFRIFEFDRFKTLVYLDNHVGGLFLQDKTHVESYTSVLRRVAAVALDAQDSRMLIADLAGEHDRVEDCRNDTGRVAQEQL